MSEPTEGAGTLWCRQCEQEYPPDTGVYCPKHPRMELVPRPPEPAQTHPGDRDSGRQRPRSVCWKCGTKSPNATSHRCASCHESLVPPTLVITFRDGPVIVQDRGTSVELGRAGDYGRVFARYPNVSRWHASLTVDADGDAWLTPRPAAPNGTFINGEEIMNRTRIRPGDEIRFATDRGPHLGPVSQQVRQPFRESAQEESGPSERDAAVTGDSGDCE